MPAKPTARRLEDVGLWLPSSEGWQINDYLKYNPSREKVLATRQARADAGRRGGQAKSEANGKQFASQFAELNPAPFPLPQENPPHPQDSREGYPQGVEDEKFDWSAVWDHVADFRLEARQQASSAPALVAPDRWRKRARADAVEAMRDKALELKQAHAVTPYTLAELLVGRRSVRSLPRAVGS